MATAYFTDNDDEAKAILHTEGGLSIPCLKFAVKNAQERIPQFDTRAYYLEGWESAKQQGAIMDGEDDADAPQGSASSVGSNAQALALAPPQPTLAIECGTPEVKRRRYNGKHHEPRTPTAGDSPALGSLPMEDMMTDMSEDAMAAAQQISGTVRF